MDNKKPAEALSQEHLQDKLITSEIRYRRLFESAKDGILILDALSGKIEDVNPFLIDLLGYTRDEFLNKSVWDIGLFKDIIPNRENFLKLKEKKYIRYENLPLQAANGRQISVEFVSNVYQEDHHDVVQCNIRDITERMLAETYREAGREILQILNEPGDLKTVIRRVLEALKTRTMADAVGLRLQEGEDFPYFIQDGFSKDFLLTENTLVERGKDGGVCRDKDGNVRLECTCGLVISGQTDPSNPLFTKGGSCWTNDSFPLLDLPSEQDPRLHPRNNCIHQGYASVALIPLRIQDQMHSRGTCIRNGYNSITQVPIRTTDRIVGLIQLNDKRKGLFSLEVIEILEDIAAHVGSALMRKQAEDELRANEALNNKIISNIGDVIVIIDQNGLVKYKSYNIEKCFGWNPGERIGKAALDTIHPDDRRKVQESTATIMDTPEATTSLECRYQCKDGSYKWIEMTIVNLFHDASINGFLGNYHDITERKQTEAKLLELNMAVEQSGDGIALADMDGHILFVNKAWTEMHGYAAEEMIGQHLSIFHTPQQLEKEVIPFNERLMETGSKTGEVGHRRKDGTIFITHMNVTVAKDATGIPFGLLAAAHDITERKDAEEALHRSNDIVENVQVGLHIYHLEDINDDRTLMMIYANPASEQMTGVSVLEVVGKTLDQNFPNLRAMNIPQRYAQVVRCNAPQSFEDVFYNDSRVMQACFSVKAFPLPNNHVGVAFENITHRKNQEGDLLKLKSAVDQSSSTIVITDMHGNIEYVNPQFEKTTGYTAEEAIGKNPRILKSEQMESSIYKELWDAISSGKEWHGEFYNKRKDGSLYWEAVSMSPIRNSEGITTHFLAVKDDISERKQAHEELLKAKEQAESANRAKSEFLANMSHEIRTPMNGVIGMTSLLLDTELDEEQRRYVEIAKSSGESLLSIINDILDYSKIEAGKLDMEILDFDLRALLSDFAVMHALRAHEKGLEFICSAFPDVPAFLRGDPGRLRQILVNLAGNAIKFTARGEVSVLATVENETDSEAFIRFSIRDTGIGIPEDKQSLLFSKFTQVDASTTRKFGGTGLGLAISKQLSEMMGGEIGLSSIEGKGSEFWFTVRLEKQDCVPDLQVPQKDVAGQRILVVDDNATNREVLMCQLKAWRVVAEEAADGPTALTLLYKARDAGKPFSCALLDMQMPGMSGTVLAQAIKADNTLKDTCLILLTSIAEKGDAKQMQEIGFSAYLPKPIRQSELLGCLKVVLSNEAGVQASKPLVTRHTIYEMKRNNVRVLLAEDNLVNQQVAQAILQKLGVRTDVVANGMEAIKALETIPYDLVFMDCHMPEMDGYEATAMIRSTTSSALKHDIPIIAMTANAMQGDRDKCLNAGMSDYIPKPVAPDMLAKVLEKWLPGSDENERLSDNGSNVPVATDLVFDYAGLKNRLMDDTKLIQKIVGIFIEDIPKKICTLKRSIVEHDNKKAEMTAHSMKGAAGNIGIIRFRNIAAQIEAAGRNRDIQEIERLIPALEKQFDIAVNAIRKKVSKQPETRGEKA